MNIRRIDKIVELINTYLELKYNTIEELTIAILRALDGETSVSKYLFKFYSFSDKILI